TVPLPPLSFRRGCAVFLRRRAGGNLELLYYLRSGVRASIGKGGWVFSDRNVGGIWRGAFRVRVADALHKSGQADGKLLPCKYHSCCGRGAQALLDGTLVRISDQFFYVAHVPDNF